MIIIWIVIIGLIIWGVIEFTRRGGSSLRGIDALDIARERYARGEITREQYEQIKKDLSR